MTITTTQLIRVKHYIQQENKCKMGVYFTQNIKTAHWTWARFPHQLDLQQILIMLQTLSGRPANDGCDRSPLSGHQFGQMQEFLLLLTWPFCLLNTGVQPLVPAPQMTHITPVSLKLLHRQRFWIGQTRPHLMYTYHLALHCLADLRCSREAIRDHWFLPYFITAALRISSC